MQFCYGNVLLQIVEILLFSTDSKVCGGTAFVLGWLSLQLLGISVPISSADWV